jgi:hypothetical protein
MEYYYVKPFVAGEFGKNTVLDNSVHPPIVHKLHYEIDVWIGDRLDEDSRADGTRRLRHGSKP